MSDSDSMDEDEKIRNFDNEAQLIVQVSSLPAKSADCYILVYNTYKKWLTEHQNSLSSSHENNLLVYFKQLQEKLKPPTLWSIWSMLRKTLYAKDNLDIKPFQNLRYFIKNNAKNYRPRKAFTFRWENVNKFMTEASDFTFLAAKVRTASFICLKYNTSKIY